MSNLRRIAILLHGERPTVVDVLLVYVVGVIAGVVILAQMHVAEAGLSALQAVFLFVLVLDITGGVVANSTRATNRWYHQRPLWVRLLFAVVHVVHPLLAIVVLDPGNWGYFGAVYLYMLLSTAMLLTLPPTRSQRPLAFAFYSVGVVSAIYLLNPVPALSWFAPAYFAKLILCFAVDHYDAS